MYDTFLLFLDGDRKLIRNRIEKRVDDMITKGLLQEIEEASKVADWPLSSMSAIGVKEWKDYFENKRSLEDTIELIKTRTKQFSKRQRTWFKHQFDGYWIDIENESDIEKAKLRILQWKQHLTE
jgi:tRNA dimethylallyltransferase